MTITYLILAGSQIAAVDDAPQLVTDPQPGIRTADAFMPHTASPTGLFDLQPILVSSLPAPKSQVAGRYTYADGVFTPVPVEPKPDTAKRVNVSRNGFANIVVAATAADYGSPEAAALHLDDVEEAMKASDDQLERVFWKRYDRAKDIDFADMEPVWSLWEAKAHYTPLQIAAIKAAWPKA